MRAVLDVVLIVLDMYRYVLIAAVVLSWLLAFNVVNLGNDLVRSLWSTLQALTEPLLRPIRRFIPNAGNLDISFIVLFLGLFFIQNVIVRYIYPNVF